MKRELRIETVRIFTASAFGALIGTIIALSLSKWLWWIGTIVGGLSGYVLYRPSMVWYGLKAAWNSLPKEREEIALMGRFVGGVALFMTVMVGVVVGMITTLIFSIELMVPFSPEPTNTQQVSPPFITLYLFSVPGVILLLTIIFAHIIWVEGDKKEQDFFVGIWGSKKGWAIVALFNPLLSPVTVPAYVIRKAVVCSKIWVPATLNFLGHYLAVPWKLTAHTFVLIHSDQRLVCMTNAAVGAAIGYTTGNILIGTLAGGALGVVMFHLVGKRFTRTATA